MGNSASMEYWNWPWAPADEVLIDAIELVWRGSQRSDHVKKAINYVKILLDKQADANARDEWGSGSAIHYAIWSGHLDVVKALLDTTTCNVEADTGQYFRGYDQYIRPVHMAAYEARPDLMRLLITAGASVDVPDRKGRTPMQCVLAPTFFDGQSLIGQPSKTTPRQRLTLQLLVEKGADVNRPFNPDSLPAIPFKKLVAQCPTALHLACDRGDVELVKVLLGGYRVDINGEGFPHAASPLQVAVEQNNLELVKILKQAGANAELARLTVATKLQHLKRHSASAVPSGGNSSASPSNGLLRTPEQLPARPAAASASPPSTSGRSSPNHNPNFSASDAKGKARSAPSSPFASPLPMSSLPEITAVQQEDVKGKRSLWPPGLPPTSGGSRVPTGERRTSGRHERRNSNSNLARLERRDSSDGQLNKLGERVNSSHDHGESGRNQAFVPPTRLHSSRSTDLLLAQ